MSQTKSQLVAPIGILTASGVSVAGIVTASNLNVSGVVTATNFIGNLTGNVTGVSTGLSGTPNINVGVVTATSFVGNLTGTATGLSGTPNLNVGVVTASSFVGNLTGTASNATTATSAASATTATTATIANELNTSNTYQVSRIGVGQAAGSGTAIDLAGRYAQVFVSVPSLDIDCSQGNYFIKSISSTSTFTFSNIPPSRAYAFTLELTTTGSPSINWPTGVRWPSGTGPVLGSSKTHLFIFVTDDGGTIWRGSSLVDYTTS